MKKIVQIPEAITISKTLRERKKRIVLAGGCFDILHVGHIEFFHQAKKHGDVLIIMLESDEQIRKLKGKNRPVNTQSDRAQILSALLDIDYIILLPSGMRNADYDSLIFSIKPAIIATTEADPSLEHKTRQAKALHVPVVDVVKKIENQSTSRIAQLISADM